MTYYIEIILDIFLIIYGIIFSSPSISLLGFCLITLSLISKHNSKGKDLKQNIRKQLKQINPEITNNINDYFCICVEISQKGDYRPLLHSREFEKFSRILEKALNNQMGDTPIMNISTNRFVIIKQFPTSQTTEISEKATYQTWMTNIISNVISKIILNNNSMNIFLSRSIIGTATSGIHYQAKTIEELIELAHYTLVIAKKRNLSYLVADDTIRFNMQDFYEFKKAFECKKTLSEFTPYFQPIIDLNLQKIVGCEVFARWNKDSYRIIEASRFKDIANEMNLMEKIDKDIIKQSFKSIYQLKQEEVISEDFFIVINVSAMTIISTEVSEILNIASKANIPPEQIEFDIKDKHFSNHIYNQKLKEFKNAGFRVALDVFDEKNFDMNAFLLNNYNTIKIDFSDLKEESIETKNKLQFYELLLNFSDNLQIKLLAKNIQNKNQLRYAKNLNIQNVQGNYFVTPMNYKIFLNFLTKYKKGLYMPVISDSYNNQIS